MPPLPPTREHPQVLPQKIRQGLQTDNSGGVPHRRGGRPLCGGVPPALRPIVSRRGHAVSPLGEDAGQGARFIGEEEARLSACGGGGRGRPDCKEKEDSEGKDGYGQPAEAASGLDVAA